MLSNPQRDQMRGGILSQACKNNVKHLVRYLLWTKYSNYRMGCITTNLFRDSRLYAVDEIKTVIFKRRQKIEKMKESYKY